VPAEKDASARGLFAGERRESVARRAREARERIVDRAELIGERAEVKDDVGAERREERQELGADARAQKARVAVRRILYERDMVSGKVRQNVGAARADERTDEVSGARGEDAEPGRACAAEQAQEDRLGPIVGVVRRGDRRCSGSTGRVAQGGVPSFARARLEIPAGRDADARPCERDAELAGDALGDVELGVGLGAQPVIDPVCDERVTDLRAKERENVKERHRVGPATDRCEHDVAALEEHVARDRASREGEEGRGMRPHADSNSLQNSITGADFRWGAVGYSWAQVEDSWRK
jgi:hypothetical protein